jgi:hypothetical protein
MAAARGVVMVAESSLHQSADSFMTQIEEAETLKFARVARHFRGIDDVPEQKSRCFVRSSGFFYNWWRIRDSNPGPADYDSGREGISWR